MHHVYEEKILKGAELISGICVHLCLQRSLVKAPGEENCRGKLTSQSAAVSQLSAAVLLPKI